ncbi:putative disease resistance RPP13 protein [Trifolium repens]|nr:putative disease resistance RPP13 protein [Trifolium repens]
MLTEFVGGGTFLCSVFQVIQDRLASRVFIDYFDYELVNKLEITLDSIKKVLEDAETKQYQILIKKVLEGVKKNWLDDLKHELYELEQVLDVVAIDAQGKSKIGRFISGSTNRFESRIKLLLKRLHVLAKQKYILGLQEDVYEIQVSREFTNREREKEETMDSVFSNSYWDDDPVPIINIVGLMGGRVKTILSQFVFYDAMIQEEFEIKVWVRVSEYFDLISLTRSILRSIHFSALDGTNLDRLKRELRQRLAGKREFLIRDNVWNKDGHTWENLLLRFSGFELHNMITITHDIEVASVMRSTQLLRSKQSEENDSWRLFVKHAFGRSRNVFDYPNLELIAEKIVEKYRGFPFALKTLGNLLRTKFNEREWVAILETPLWRLDEDDNNINSILRLFYHNLCSNLKRCFAYCSIFPKGYEFEKDDLIKLWMAEGLLKWGSDKNEEELGNNFFNHLVSISFFQQSIIMPLWTSKYYFTMHDLVNDLAKSVSGESCLRIEGENVQDIPERTRHIWCCLDLKDGDRKLEHISKIEGLRSLMVEAQGYGHQRFKISTNVQQKLFSSLKYLRMLSFSGCNLLELDDEIRNLKLLRYLDLSYTEIASLPNSICMLSNLQTLLLQDCFKLTELPSDFCKLLNLRHLNLEGTHIKKMPTKIGGLNNLQTLTDFVVGEQHGSDLKQLGKLNHLQGRLQISGLENVIDPADAVATNLKYKKHLEELSMSYGEWTDIDGSVTKARVSVLEALQPNRKLMRLTIKDYRDSSLPNWLGDDHLSNLLSLELFGCKLPSQMPPFGQFPSLKKLSFSGCDGIEIIGTEFYCYNSSHDPFRSLEILRFEHMSEWKEWLCIEGFPLLQELCIKHCPKLKSALPQHLPSLQKLEIIDCQELEASIPKAANISELELKRCDEILINELPSSLKRVILCGTQVIQSSLEKILFNSDFLEELEVEDFFGENLELSSSDFNSCNSLRTLTIIGWHSSSLPFALHLFTNLNSLVLYDSPWLESFFGWQLPSNLCNLRIERCPKLMASREEWGLFQLNSLKQFRVSDDFEIFESFPEESLLPSSINSLELTNCSNLSILNYKGLLHLTSLESLYIEDCPSLESLPEEGLPSSLSTLSIHDCPLIMQQYQKEQGERWHTISHIPDVTIS